jgi:deoxycytidylate deaminase
MMLQLYRVKRDSYQQTIYKMDKEMVSTKNIKYPYLPEGRVYLYGPENNPFMIEARMSALKYSIDNKVKTGGVVVKDGAIIGRGANGSEFHKNNICMRVKLNCPTGQGYELCEGCHPKNHCEPKACLDAKNNRHDTKNADLYLWGHWWCCEPCWQAMISAGIKNVYLMENSEKLFNHTHPENILGRQLELFSHLL